MVRNRAENLCPILLFVTYVTPKLEIDFGQAIGNDILILKNNDLNDGSFVLHNALLLSVNSRFRIIALAILYTVLNDFSTVYEQKY